MSCDSSIGEGQKSILRLYLIVFLFWLFAVELCFVKSLKYNTEKSI